MEAKASKTSARRKGKRPLTLWLTDEEKDRLRELASRQDGPAASMTETIRWLINRASNAQ